jgi:hypothetical protein
MVSSINVSPLRHKNEFALALARVIAGVAEFRIVPQ